MDRYRHSVCFLCWKGGSWPKAGGKEGIRVAKRGLGTGKGGLRGHHCVGHGGGIGYGVESL